MNQYNKVSKQPTMQWRLNHSDQYKHYLKEYHIKHRQQQKNRFILL
jgi:hypothetical protein